MFKQFLKITSAMDRAIEKIPHDKKEHIKYGLIIFIAVTLLVNIQLGLIVTVLVGAGKELIWDLALGKGTPELDDFVATVIIPHAIYAIYSIVSLILLLC